MIPYILKSILCLAILLVVYFLFLEKEKMHRFNRWYLLGSIVFACLVPLISFNISSQSIPVLQDDYFKLLDADSGDNSIAATPALSILKQETTNYTVPALFIIYGVVTASLLLRFTRNIYLLLSSAAKTKMITYQGAKLVLLKEKTASYSFLNYIFISEDDYKDQAVEKELITHELTHVKQKHSWDVIFIELLQAFFWFNPLFIFYKKAIQLNHEYLADDAVIKQYENIPAYQYLLLEKISLGSKTYLTSNFNYSVTKKRLVMMTRTINTTRSFAKKIFLIPVLVSAIALFSAKIVAQSPPVVMQKSPEVPSTKEGVSQQLLDEMNAIVEKNINKTKNGHYVLENVSEPERNRLETIYLQMSKAQQAESRVVFQKKIVRKPVGQPSDALFESFKDPAKFGVWINGKKVTNDVLDKYKASDFGDYWSSNLYYNEKMKQNVMKMFNLTVMYDKQLELTTTKVAEENYQREITAAKTHPYSMFFRYDKRIMGYVN